MNESVIRIAYLGTKTITRMDYWSSIPWTTYSMLQKYPITITQLELCEPSICSLAKLKLNRLVYSRLMDMSYPQEAVTSIYREYAKKINRHLVKDQFDIILLHEPEIAAYLETSVPIVIYHDAPFQAMVGMYNFYTHLPRSAARQIDGLAHKYTKNASKMIYSSQWACDASVENYGASPSKLAILPFPPGFKAVINSIKDVQTVLDRRSSNTCSLFFTCPKTAWDRKGGDKMLAILEELESRDFDYVAHMICPYEKVAPHINRLKIKHYPRLDKANKGDLITMMDLYANAHFMMFPANGDVGSIAISEACAFAVPCLATDVGAVGSIVINGKTGQLFDITDEPKKYAEYIICTFRDRAYYENLAISTFNFYTENLSWEVIGGKMWNILKQVSGNS